MIQWRYVLFDKDASGGGTPLCESLSLGISISPDDHWILIQDGGSSLGLHQRLFSRKDGAHYVEHKVDIDEAVFKAVAGSPEGKKVDVNLLDHTYLSCDGWSADGKKAALTFSGHGAANGHRLEITHFLCSLTPQPLSVTPGHPATVIPGSLPGKPGPGRLPRAGVPQLIEFAEGAKTARVNGSIMPPKKAATFALKAEKGQHLFLNVIPQKGLATAGHIKTPSGKEDGMPGGVIFDGSLEESGEYLITITPHHMAESADQGSFVLEVVLR